MSYKYWDKEVSVFLNITKILGVNAEMLFLECHDLFEC